MGSDGECQILAFVEVVCRRPAMYTLTGTFGEAVSFLEGWYGATARYGSHAGAELADREWTGFGCWLSGKIGSTEDTRGAMQALRLMCPNDDAAFSRAQSLYEEYFKSLERD